MNDSIVEDIASICIGPTGTIRQALEVLETTHKEIALVVDGDRRLLGSITDGDVRRATLAGYAVQQPVEKIMNSNPVVGSPQMLRREMLQLMNFRSVEQLPLVGDTGVVVGLVRMKELARVLEPMIPLLELPITDGEVDAVQSVLHSGWLTMGDLTERLEVEFAEFVGVDHAIAVNSGTAALHLAHRILGIEQGDEVICPSLSFVATSNAILYSGATPIFVDVTSVDDFTIDPVAVEAAITRRTKAIIAMHYGGNSCNLVALRDIARRHGLYLIEDAAHAPGASCHGRMCGAWGEIGCFSFYSNKNLTTGEGGMITTNNFEHAERLRLLRSHAMTSSAVERHRGESNVYDVVDLGYNYRLDEIRSALGLEQLRALQQRNSRRRQLVRIYRGLLVDCPGVHVPFADSSIDESACHIFPVVLNAELDREEISELLRLDGIQTSVHYPAIHELQYYAERFSCHLPITEEISKKELTLPLYPSMSKQQIERVVDVLSDAVANSTLLEVTH